MCRVARQEKNATVSLAQAIFQTKWNAKSNLWQGTEKVFETDALYSFVGFAGSTLALSGKLESAAMACCPCWDGLTSRKAKIAEKQNCGEKSSERLTILACVESACNAGSGPSAAPCSKGGMRMLVFDQSLSYAWHV